MTLAPRCLALVLAAGPALADAPPAETITTPTGHEITHIALPDAEYGDVTLFWPGPTALAVPGLEGLFSLAPQLAFERAGGRGFDEGVEGLEDAGATVGLLNLFGGTVLFMQMNDAGGLDAAAAFASDLLTDAALAEEDLDRLKRDFADGLAETERDPQAMAERALGALVADGDRRLAALTNRPFETVEQVEASDVRAWMDETFHADPLVISAGPVEGAEVAAAVDMVLDDLPGPEGEPAAPEPIALAGSGRTVAVRAPEADVALVSVAFPVPVRAPELGAGLSALAGGDGSRLFERVREEEGASYGLELGAIVLLPDLQIVTIGGAVPPERAGEVLAMVREELMRLREEGITAPELDAAREEQRAGEAAALADPGTITSVLVDLTQLGEAPDPALIEQADALTLEGVNAALPGLIPDAVAAVVVTPKPETVDADCVVDVPEEAARCDG